MNKKFDLKNFRAALNLTQDDIAENLGITQPFLSRVEKGRDLLPENHIPRLRELYGGKVDEFFIDVEQNEIVNKESNIFNKELPYRLVPLINFDAIGGFNNNEMLLSNKEYTINYIPFNDAQEDDICIPVSGNSMSPTCPPGSIILIRKVERWEEYFGFGGIFVLLLNDGRRILKEITKCDENPKEYVLCVSHNKSVPDEPIPRNLIGGVWKVIKMLNEYWY